MAKKSRMTKLLSAILAVIMLMGIVPVGGIFASAATEGNFMYRISGDSAVLYGCKTDTAGDVVIPETLGGYPVGSISVHTFGECDSITSITMPDSVKTIGIGAFANCDNLKTVKIGAGVISIGEGAFEGSSNLEKIEVNPSNTAYKSDDNGALYTADKKDLLVYPTSNTAVTFVVASEVEVIRDSAFAGSKNVKTIIIGDNVKSIGKNAFLGSRSLEVIMLGSAVESIGSDAFEGCEKLTSITVQAKNPVLCSDEAGVLYSKDKKYLIKYPNAKSSVSYAVADETEIINVLAFANAKGLVEISFGKNMKEIGASAFSGCTVLSKVNYAGSAAEWKNVVIGANNDKLLAASFAFAGGDIHEHSYTSSEATPATCTSAGVMLYTCSCGHSYTDPILAKGHAFENNTCKNCSVKEFVIATDGTRAKITGYNGDATYLAIPATIEGYAVNAIGDNVFENREKVVSITIPDGVEEIGSCAFYKTGFYNNSANWTDGILYIGKYLIEANGSISSTCSVREGTEVIADYAFSGRTNLTAITFPASLKVIGDAAFSSCTALADVNCSVRVGEWEKVKIGTANEPLTSATFTFVPEPHVHAYDEVVEELKVTCTTAGYKVSKCSCGETVREDYPAPGHIFKNNVCDGCSGREYEISIKDNEVTINGCHESINGKVVLPSSIGGYTVAAIGNNAFAGNEKITEVVIPSTVTSIGDKAFFNCDELTDVQVPASVATIGDLAFADCAKLAKLSVNAENAKFVTDENGVLFNKDKSELLYYPTGKTEAIYEIPANVKAIGENAFAGNKALVSVIIPVSVLTIKSGAFDGCEGLLKVKFAGTETKWNRVIIKDKNDAIVKAEKEFADLSDAEKAVEVAKNLVLYNAEVKTNGVNIIITEKSSPDGTIGVGIMTADGKSTVVIDTKDKGFAIKDDVYVLDFEAWHKAGNKTETTLTIGEDTYPVIFVFTSFEGDGHVFYEPEKLEPTCVDKGCTRYTCKICGVYHDEDEVDALGHKYGAWVIEKDETCTEDGVKVRECTVCEELTDGHFDKGVVKATGHKYSSVVTEATCHEGGYTTYTCSKCSDVEIGDIVPAKGHSYGEWVGTDATCTTDGEKVKTCTACAEGAEGHTVTAFTPAFGHEYKAVVTLPTETEEGYTTHICIRCADSYVDSYVAPVGKVKSVKIEGFSFNKDETKQIVPVIDVTPGVKYAVVFESSDESIATVDENGVVTAMNKGKATITCVVTDQFGNKVSSSCEVEVKFTVIQWFRWIFVDVIYGWIKNLFA